MKKQEKIIKKVIAIICFLTQILFGIPTVAYSTEDVESSSEAVALNDSSAGTTEVLSNSAENPSPEITYAIIDPINPTSPTTTITFDKTNIDSFVLNTNGISIVDNFVDEAANTASYTIIATEDFGTLEVVAQANGVSVANKTIYTYRNDNSIYLSEASNDTAWHKYMQNKFDNNLITIDAWHDAYSEQSESFSENDFDCSFGDFPEITEDLSEGKILVRGRMSWTTDKNAVLPMRFTKVELRKKQFLGSSCISSTFTDENGYYYFILDSDELGILPNSSINVFVRTHTESMTFDVCYPFREHFNYFDSHLETISATTSGTVNISRKLKRDEGCMPYRLTYIQQGMVLGQRFALDMGMPIDEDNRLHVFYLGDTKQILENMGLGELESKLYSNEIAFCFDTISFIGYNNYDKFTTTTHEYGHYVENRMGNYGDAVKGQIVARIPEIFDGKFSLLSNFIQAVSDTIDDYSHEKTDNHFEENSGKAFQMQLTWSESWAEAFAEIARHKYSYDYSGVYSFSNSSYESDPFINYNGEAQEYAVTSFLWDLYDDKSESGDDIELDVEEWWDLTTKTGTYTLQDFSETILNDRPDLIGKIGIIFSNHNISPHMLSTILPCTTADGMLKLFCNVNGSSTHPNNKFQVAFYDSEFNRIGITDKINDDNESDTGFTCAVPKEVWVSVMEECEEGEKIYAVIYGYRGGEFDSGPYFSESIEVWNENLSHTYSIEGYDNLYHWDECKCGVKNSVITRHSSSYTHTDSTGGTHIKSCKSCSYSVVENHTAYNYESISNNNHMVTCVCGYEIDIQPHDNHHFEYSSSNSISHTIHCICGKLMKTENHRFTMMNGRTCCQYCGYIRPTGQIILGKKEEELII
ncbi:MAG: hypothetical protein IJX58_06625 [Clostridia bacterium]|nr:hypothetical protein [Clostridia bacterium]